MLVRTVSSTLKSSPAIRNWVTLVLAPVVAVNMGCSEKPAPRPPVVLIIVDTLRADAILDPEEHYETPAIDLLAADGVLFDRALAHAPMTLPSHTALFSSRPPLQTGVLNNGQAVPLDLPLLPEWLAVHGYECRAVTSLGTLTPHPSGVAGLDRGFDHYDKDFRYMDTARGVYPRIESTIAQRDPTRPLFLFAHFSDPHEPYTAHSEDGRRVLLRIDGIEVTTLQSDAFEVFQESIPLSPGKHQIELIAEHKFKLRALRCSEGAADIAIDWIRDPGPPSMRKLGTFVREKPPTDSGPRGDVDLEIWVTDSPPPEELRRRYELEVSYVDGYVGRLLERLKSEGLYDDALIIFTSDHGEGLGHYRGFGHVDNLTEELIAVPLIVKLPARSRREAWLNPARLARHVDLAPTILDLLGMPPLPGQTGRSLLRDDDEAPVHISQTHKPEAPRDKLSLTDERFKMIYTVDDESFRMFDLLADPGETQDIFATALREGPEWAERRKAMAELTRGRTRDDEQTDAALHHELRALGYAE